MNPVETKYRMIVISGLHTSGMLSIKDVAVPFLVIVAFLTVISISGCSGLSSSTDGPDRVPDAASVMGGGGTDPAELVNEAWSLNAQEKFTEANTLLDKASSLDRSTPGLAFNRGWALTGLGRYDEALAALDQALAENPGSAISWSNKGYALAHLGRCEEAKKAYTRAHDLEPTNRAIMSSLNSLGSRCTSTGIAPPTTVPATARPVAQTVTSTVRSVSTVAVQSTQAQQLVMENINGEEVINGATKAPTFTFSTPVVIISLYTYHWNDGKGDTPGIIEIKNANTGELFGPFTAKGLPTKDGKQNVFWSVEPGITLPAGTYWVKDSNPSTWSQNEKTGGAGMTHIVYQPVASTSFSSPSKTPDRTIVPGTTTKGTTGTLSAADLGTVWTVRESDVFVMKEFPGAGNFEGTWTRRPGTNTFDARMTGGVVSGATRDDVIDIVSVTGNTIVMYSHDINGQYTGTISPDGKSINGKGDWYEPTGKWTVTIA
jgi:hypothetical protein